MKLDEFKGGLYPPRVGIDLAEKGIADVERMAFDMFAWPPPEMAHLGPLGTVPIFQADDGRLIRSSMAIIEYLEELHPRPNMLGNDPCSASAYPWLNCIDQVRRRPESATVVAYCH